MHNAEEDRKDLGVKAYRWSRIGPVTNHRKMDAGRTAIKEIGKYHHKKVADKQNEEYVMSDHPSFRRQACQSSVKKSDGDLDKSNGEKEKNFGHGDPLY